MSIDPNSEKALADLRRTMLLQRVAEQSQQSLQEENKVLKAEVFRLTSELERLSNSAAHTDRWASNYQAYSGGLAKTSGLIALS